MTKRKNKKLKAILDILKPMIFAKIEIYDDMVYGLYLVYDSTDFLIKVLTEEQYELLKEWKENDK